MKRFFMITAVAAALGASAFAGPTIVQRQHRQQARINQGVRSGELTRREAAELRAKEARLNRQIQRDRVDGGGLTAKERNKIDKLQDALSREITREKHDGQSRP